MSYAHHHVLPFDESHPQWLRATVWAAQWASSALPEPAPPCFRRCAACSADLSFANAKSRCSRCKKVFFCDKSCQIKALPVHKHHCVDQASQKQSQQAMDTATSLGEAAKASSSRSPKPLKQLQKKLDSLKTKQANGKSLSVQESYNKAELYLAQSLECSQPLDRACQNKACIDAIHVSRCAIEHNDSKAYEQRFKVRLKLCKAVMVSAEKHQDIHVLAVAYSAASEFTENKDRQIEWKQHSRQSWICMVKAALLQGEIGTSAGGAHVCVKPLLGDTFRLCQWLAESWRSAEAEPLLLEVQQVCRELPPDVKQQQESRNRAGDYKQQLFVAMIDQDKPVATSCGLCKEPLHAHKVAGPEPLDGVFVSYCCHLFHTPCALSCLNRTCPVCQQSFSYLLA